MDLLGGYNSDSSASNDDNDDDNTANLSSPLKTPIITSTTILPVSNTTTATATASATARNTNTNTKIISKRSKKLLKLQAILPPHIWSQLSQGTGGGGGGGSDDDDDDQGHPEQLQLSVTSTSNPTATTTTPGSAAGQPRHVHDAQELSQLLQALPKSKGGAGAGAGAGGSFLFPKPSLLGTGDAPSNSNSNSSNRTSARSAIDDRVGSGLGAAFLTSTVQVTRTKKGGGASTVESIHGVPAAPPPLPLPLPLPPPLPPPLPLPPPRRNTNVVDTVLQSEDNEDDEEESSAPAARLPTAPPLPSSTSAYTTMSSMSSILSSTPRPTASFLTSRSAAPPTRSGAPVTAASTAVGTATTPMYYYPSTHDSNSLQGSSSYGPATGVYGQGGHATGSAYTTTPAPPAPPPTTTSTAPPSNAKKYKSKKRQMEALLRAGHLSQIVPTMELNASDAAAAHGYEEQCSEEMQQQQQHHRAQASRHGVRVVPTSSYQPSQGGMAAPSTDISAPQRGKNQLNVLLQNAASLEAARVRTPGSSHQTQNAHRANAKRKYGW